MSSPIPTNQRTTSLNDGNRIPVIGLGTYLSKPNEVRDAVLAGWRCGVRHFDCAQFYQNEKEIGSALAILRKEEPSFKREDLFITSKAWNSHHRPENLNKALDQTLKDLGTEYLDLYLIHWPVNFAAVTDAKSDTGVKLEPFEEGIMLLDRELSLTTTWEAMIDVQKAGKVKSIGVSNFSPAHVQRLINETGVVPAVNQVEAHPLLIQQELLDYSKAKGIHVTAYMPFGGDATRGGAKVLGNPVVDQIASKFGKDAGQVLGSWGIKRGFSVLPKSVKPSRIESNFQVFDIDNESYETLTELGRKAPARFGGLPFTFDPAWKVNVFDTPEERNADLLEPF
ncbi:aldehyde reductase 1 [Colletotrichum orchidophilum]|uniref:Aldehyde reductase 1 n=1 Tax=Colletotrichum orchidophilum TaxID=1209926 RepID=A0A1G4BRL6_9PEZI|nr:aldehyde reductase 1 [Colletotrichum orchidophilum]OHF04031.1 aldehyde reductase 1 [Colletotrichum orchidophilum]